MRRLLRPRSRTGLILLAALAGCGSSRPDNNAAGANNAIAAQAPTPAAPDAEARGLAEYRADALRGCLGAARETAPPGTPVERHCDCAVERVMAGRTLAALEADERTGEYEGRFQGELRTCIAEIGGLE